MEEDFALPRGKKKKGNCAIECVQLGYVTRDPGVQEARQQWYIWELSFNTAKE